MSFSRRTLSLATIVIILGVLAGGVWWRLAGQGEGEGASAEEVGGEDLPEVQGAEQFSASVPQPAAPIRL